MGVRRIVAVIYKTRVPSPAPTEPVSNRPIRLRRIVLALRPYVFFVYVYFPKKKKKKQTAERAYTSGPSTITFRSLNGYPSGPNDTRVRSSSAVPNCRHAAYVPASTFPRLFYIRSSQLRSRRCVYTHTHVRSARVFRKCTAEYVKIDDRPFENFLAEPENRTPF